MYLHLFTLLKLGVSVDINVVCSFLSLYYFAQASIFFSQNAILIICDFQVDTNDDNDVPVVGCSPTLLI